MERINLIQAKGGQGTSVTACAVALAAAGRGLRVHLDGEDRDALEAILGMGPGGGVVLPGLVLGDANGHEFDLEVHDGPGEEGITLLVTRGCYLALRRAVRQAVRPAGVVLVEEPGRALGATEVAEVIGAPVVARVPVRPAIARAVDAGVLAARLPAALDLAAKTVLDFAPRPCPDDPGPARMGAGSFNCGAGSRLCQAAPRSTSCRLPSRPLWWHRASTASRAAR